MYRKEIVYMGLYKDGERLGNAGFLRVEKRDRESSLSLAVKNVPRSIEGRFPVRYYIGTEWKEADGITLREGGGQWEKKEQDLLEQVRLQITLPGGYLVEGKSKTVERRVPSEKPDEERAVEGIAEKTGEEIRDSAGEEIAGKAGERIKESAGAEITGKSGKRIEEGAGEEIREKAWERTGERTVPERTVTVLPEIKQVSKRQADSRELEVLELSKGRNLQAEKTAKRESFRRERDKKEYPGKMEHRIEHIAVQRQENRTEEPLAPTQPQRPLMADTFAMEGLKEDKWEQILDIYDKIHPYGDERVYVKLTPKDFIILSSKYQHLVNNSFLLHGFYNYRHVILGKEGEYYLGVPGVYYEREKMVALMFGFEAFECASGKPETGEFGYYLRKVEL